MTFPAVTKVRLRQKGVLSRPGSMYIICAWPSIVIRALTIEEMSSWYMILLFEKTSNLQKWIATENTAIQGDFRCQVSSFRKGTDSKNQTIWKIHSLYSLQPWKRKLKSSIVEVLWYRNCAMRLEKARTLGEMNRTPQSMFIGKRLIHQSNFVNLPFWKASIVKKNFVDRNSLNRFGWRWKRLADRDSQLLHEF